MMKQRAYHAHHSNEQSKYFLVGHLGSKCLFLAQVKLHMDGDSTIGHGMKISLQRLMSAKQINHV
jgi:hypothetical protein